VQEQGLSPALSATNDLYEIIGPSLDLLINIGIAGGLSDDDLKVGDVVSGSHVYEVDRNEKYRAGVQGKSTRLAGPKPFDLENRFKSAIKRFRGDFDAIGEWSSNVESQLAEFGLSPSNITDQSSSQATPTLSVGPIASSGSVVADRGASEVSMSEHILGIDRNILVVDQESAAVVQQVKRNNAKFSRHVLPGILRGVSDFADSDKGTDEAGRQDYAMFSATSLFKYLLESGCLDDIFNKTSPSERIPSAITPPAITRAQKIASTLRGQVEGKFGVLHRSLEDPPESLPAQKEDGMPIPEILLELMIDFETQCLESKISLTNGAAMNIFSETLRDYRNVLYFLEYDLRSQIPKEERAAGQLAQNISNALLRIQILETTISRGAVGGTAVDSFSCREWETEEMPPGHFGRGQTIWVPKASQVVVLERFDSGSATKYYEVCLTALNGRVEVEKAESARTRCEIPEGGCDSVSFNITEADTNERRTHRFDESQYPWGDMDILKIDIFESPAPLSDLDKDLQEVGEEWLAKQNINHSTFHTALPGVDQEQGGISVPVV